jgi:hypothetical protein
MWACSCTVEAKFVCLEQLVTRIVVLSDFRIISYYQLIVSDVLSFCGVAANWLLPSCLSAQL